MWSSNLNSSGSFAGGFLDNSRKGGQEDVKVRRIQTLVPTMIRHLNKASSTEEIKFWDTTARMFRILGIVRNIEETATKISYSVEDQTGTITALKWLEADRKASEKTLQVNTYIRIIGLLRGQNNTRHVLILRMWPVQNLNELTNHLLQVTFTTLKAASMSIKNNETKDQIQIPAADEKPSENSPIYGMTIDQTLVYKIIHAQNDSESGIEKPEIKIKVPKRLLWQIDTILDFLVSEGHIYTTSTDNHFKAT